MPAQRKTILVIHPPASDPAETRRLLGNMGYIAVTAAGQRAALKALAAVRFDFIFTSFGAAPPGSARSFVQELRLVAPGSAVVGLPGAVGAGLRTTLFRQLIEASKMLSLNMRNIIVAQRETT